MEIGPVSGIRPIAMIRKSSSSPDLSGVFAVELRKQAHDDASADERDARGLEDEEAEDESASAEDESSSEEIVNEGDPQAASASKVSFFA